MMKSYLLISFFLSATTLGSSLQAMEEVVAKKRLNAEQFKVLKELIGGNSPKKFIRETEKRFPESFSEGMPDDLFKDLDGEALQWIVTQEALIKKCNVLDNPVITLWKLYDKSDEGKKRFKRIADAGVYLDIQPIILTIEYIFKYRSTISKELIELAIKYKDIAFADYSLLLIYLVESDMQEKNEFIKLLLHPRLKVKKDASDKYGNTALSRAIEKEDVTLVRLLIQNGVSPDLQGKDSNGKLETTPLWKAYYSRCFSVFNFLLDAGANPDVREDHFSSSGNTLLIEAIIHEMEDFSKKLIDSGADVSAKAGNGGTALMYAAAKDNEALVRWLLEKSGKEDIDHKDKEGMTALHCAASCGRESNVKLLLDAGANVDIVNANDKTALDIAKQKAKYLKNKKACYEGIIALLEAHFKE